MLPSVVLYRDDLERVIELFDAAYARVSISDGEYEFQSLEELEGKRGRSIRALKISGSNAGAPLDYLTLEFRRVPFTGTLLIVGDAERGAAAFAQIKDELQSRQRLLCYALSPAFWVPLCLLASTAWPLLSNYPLAAAMMFPVATACMLLSLAMRFGTFYTLSLSRRHETVPWLRSKGHDLLMIFIGAVIGGAGARLVDWLTSLWPRE